MFKSLIATVSAGILMVGGYLGIVQKQTSPFIYDGYLTPKQEEQVKTLVIQYVGQQNLGAVVEPIAGATYNLSGAGVAASSSSITLQSLTIPQTGQAILTADLSDTFYITLEPGNRTRQEIASCTTVTQNSGGTATLSGCSRGLSPIPPFTASTTLRFAHGGGTQVIFSDPPQLFNQFAAKSNDETISGLFNFSISPVIGTATNTYQAASRLYVDQTAFQGAPTSTFSTMGLAQLATRQELSLGTASSSTGKPLIFASLFATSTPSLLITGAGGTNEFYVPVTETDGKLSQLFLDLTENFDFGWNRSTTTFMGAIGIGTSTPSLWNQGLSIASSTYIAGGLGVGKATTTNGNIETSGDILVGNKLLVNFFLKNVISTSTSALTSLNTGDTNVTTVTAACPEGAWVFSSGYKLQPNTAAPYVMTENWPTSSTTWQTTFECHGGGSSCGAGTIRLHIYCINP